MRYMCVFIVAIIMLGCTHSGTNKNANGFGYFHSDTAKNVDLNMPDISGKWSIDISSSMDFIVKDMQYKQNLKFKNENTIRRNENEALYFTYKISSDVGNFEILADSEYNKNGVLVSRKFKFSDELSKDNGFSTESLNSEISQYADSFAFRKQRHITKGDILVVKNLHFKDSSGRDVEGVILKEIVDGIGHYNNKDVLVTKFEISNESSIGKISINEYRGYCLYDCEYIIPIYGESYIEAIINDPDLGILKCNLYSVTQQSSSEIEIVYGP